MKTCLISLDDVHEDSFYVKDGQAFLLDGSPFIYDSSIGNSIYRNIWSIPMVYGGYYQNFHKNQNKINFNLQ